MPHRMNSPRRRLHFALGCALGDERAAQAGDRVARISFSAAVDDSEAKAHLLPFNFRVSEIVACKLCTACRAFRFALTKQRAAA